MTQLNIRAVKMMIQSCYTTVVRLGMILYTTNKMSASQITYRQILQDKKNCLQGREIKITKLYRKALLI